MSKRTILVVKDDCVQRRQIARVLQKAGYNVSEAFEGLEAIRILDARKTDLVLTDSRTPCLHGISLLKYIKIFFQQVPVLVITAHLEKAEDINPDAVLCKPLDEDDLITWVRHFIKAPSLWAPIPGRGTDSGRRTKPARSGKSTAYNFYSAN